MSSLSGLEIFEAIVEKGGRILRAEADGRHATPHVLVLTFDVGRVVIQSDEQGLSVEQVGDRASVPDGLTGLDDEEPWWRLFGQPLSAAWPGGVADGVGARGLGSLMMLKLRFREESENSRVVLLETVGRAVRVSLEED